MKANFVSCLAFTLRYEGGAVDDARDPGGRTKQGVTQRTYAAFRKTAGRPAADVYGMAPLERDAIYRAEFWDRVEGDRVPDGVDLALFDFGVNSGPARALRAYRACAAREGAALVKELCAARLSFLHGLATFRVFGRGWTARVAACEALGVKMAEHARIGIPAAAPVVPQVATRLAVDGRAAHAVARTQATAAGAIAVTAASAAAVGSTLDPVGAGSSWGLWLGAAAGLVAVLGLAGLIAWKAHLGRLRAQAYAAVATAR